MTAGSHRGCFFFLKQKTAYEIRPRDWSSDVCSSDLSCCPACRCRTGCASRAFTSARSAGEKKSGGSSAGSSEEPAGAARNASASRRKSVFGSSCDGMARSQRICRTLLGKARGRCAGAREFSRPVAAGGARNVARRFVPRVLPRRALAQQGPRRRRGALFACAEDDRDDGQMGARHLQRRALLLQTAAEFLDHRRVLSFFADERVHRLARLGLFRRAHRAADLCHVPDDVSRLGARVFRHAGLPHDARGAALDARRPFGDRADVLDSLWTADGLPLAQERRGDRRHGRCRRARVARQRPASALSRCSRADPVENGGGFLAPAVFVLEHRLGDRARRNRRAVAFDAPSGESGFAQGYFLKELGRTLFGPTQTGNPFYYYFIKIFESYWPWLPFAAVGFYVLGRGWKRSPGARLWIVYAAVLGVVVMTTPEKRIAISSSS